MLSGGSKTQAELIEALTSINDRADPRALATALGPEWTSGLPNDLRLILGKGPVGLSLKEFGAEAHMVYAERIKGTDQLLIRDPWPPKTGKTYTIKIDDIYQYLAYAVWQVG